MAGVVPNNNFIAFQSNNAGGGSGSDDCGCITKLWCWDEGDPNYNPCGREANLKITANFTEGIPQLQDAGIIFSAEKIINPPTTGLVKDEVAHAVDGSGLINQAAYFGFADLYDYENANFPGTYSISKKDIDANNVEITIKGASIIETNLDTLEAGKFLVLVKQLNSIQAMPKRLSLFYDNIYDVVEIPNGVKFKYFLGVGGNAAQQYWQSETNYKIKTKGSNKFFDGKKMTKQFLKNATAYQPDEFKFVRTIEYSNECGAFKLEKDITVTEAKYPFDFVDAPVVYPISFTTVDTKI